MMRAGSLTARFAIVNLCLMALVLVAVTAIEYHVARKQIDVTYDQRLASAGSMLRALMDEELDAAATDRDTTRPLVSLEDKRALTSEFGRHIAFSIWYRGTLNQRNGGPSFDMPVADGFGYVDEAAGRWRVFATLDPAADVAILVAEPTRERREVIWRAVGDLVLPGLLLVPGMLLGLWFVAVYGMGTVRRLAGQIAERSPGDLGLLPEQGWPAELKPLVTGTNNLLTRLDAAFQLERRVVDLAAHQLRTPLTSMLVQVQSARRTGDPEKLQQIMARLETTLLQAASLTDRLLALARLEAQGEQRRNCDLRPELEKALVEVLPLSEAKNQTITVQAAARAPVALDAESCRLVCSCLLENAVKYSPPDTAVAVTLSSDGGMTEFTVEDQGPGIPEAEREKVLERFSRGKAAAGTAGSGLGLSIVLAAAKRAGGRVELASGRGGRGLRVALSCPASAESEAVAA